MEALQTRDERRARLGCMGVQAGCMGVQAWMHGVAGWMRGVAGWMCGVAAWVHGVAAPRVVSRPTRRSHRCLGFGFGFGLGSGSGWVTVTSQITISLLAQPLATVAQSGAKATAEMDILCRSSLATTWGGLGLGVGVRGWG